MARIIGGTMANSENPYQAPAADLVSVPSHSAEAYTPGMVQALKETKPWVRFLSILGFIISGLFILGGLLFAGLAAIMPELSGNGSAGVTYVVVLAYMAMGGIGIVPFVQLHKYANSIGDVARGAGAAGIESALARQRSFWRISGIMAVVVIGLYVAALFAGIVASLLGAISNP
jgi:hypothetical protein